MSSLSLQFGHVLGCVLIIGCLQVSACKPAPQEAVSQSFHADHVTADIETLVEKYAAPGLAVAVISDGKIIYDASFGLKDIEELSPVDSKTQFGIGSVVKSFTSGLIGSLESDGLLDLNQTPVTYVEDLIFKDSNLRENLKLSNLLSQTSGLPSMDGSYAFFPEENQADLSPRFKYFPSSCRVGDCWSYNNMNFAMLDMVAERVSQISKTDLLAMRLLEPVGMDDSVSSTSAFLMSAHAAKPYGMNNGEAISVAYENFYGEHIYATAPDMARWLAMWMNNGMVQGNSVLPASYVQSAISMKAISDGAPPQKDDPHVYMHGYGYGWMVKSVGGHYLVHHGGNENGFSAHVMFSPASHIGVVALTNQQSSILPNLVTDLLMRKLLALPETDIADYPVLVTDITKPLSNSDATLSPNLDKPMTMTLEEIIGAYKSKGYGEIKVYRHGGQLALETPLARFVLTHEAGNTYRLGSTSSLHAGININFFQVEFEPDKFMFNIAAEPVVFSKVK